MRKVVASEHYDLSSLQTVYGSYPSTKLAFRIFHIQNAPWATYWVLKKFAIQETSFESRTSFTHWVKYMSPKRRGGKALMNAHTWNTKYDPQRGISRTAFGLDYLKRYPKRTPALDDDLEVTGDQKYEAGKVPMMELNSYDSEGNPQTFKLSVNGLIQRQIIQNRPMTSMFSAFQSTYSTEIHQQTI
jgi:hypothetical protein